MRCSICGREFEPQDEGAAMPFCSLRCKRIDACRWLDEEYGLPYDRDEEEAASEGDPRDGDDE